MEYGEPWSNKNGFIENRDGVDIDGTRQSDTRAVACVNSLSGIPDSWLANRAAAKALLCDYIRTNFLEIDKIGGFWASGLYLRHPQHFCISHGEEVVDGLLATALRLRSRGADFGELNQLIDSFKDE